MENYMQPKYSEIKLSKHGLGVFATKDISKGTTFRKITYSNFRK